MENRHCPLRQLEKGNRKRGKEMKHTNIFPLERNHYYYGKLLSVDDFNLEQKYNCNKHRFNHMFLSGSGVVCGMNVLRVGDASISIESGCALDAFGRELVIDVPVIKKLQMVDGFESATGRGENYVYLCVEYAEKGMDQAYNIAGTEKEQCTYNKVAESYHLFLTNKEPDENVVDGENLFEDTRCLYFRDGISIKQTVPRYAEIGKKAVVTVEIETTEKNFLAFSYTMNLNGFTYEKENSLTVHFDELLVEKAGNYRLTYELTPAATNGYEAIVTIVPDSFKVVIDQKQKETRAEQKYKTQITEGDIKEKMIADYYKLSMESLVEKAHQKYIYLAKIYLTKAGENYLIDKVVEVPFHQYVMNQVLLETVNRVVRQDIRNLERKVLNLQDKECSGGTQKQDEYTGIQVADGVYEMEFGMYGENHRKFFSPPIVHGLGLGYVTIILSQETKRNEMIFGNAEIFQEKYVDVDLAAQLDESTGSFIIGAQLKETVARNSIRIKWTAIRKASETAEEKIERRMNIKPSMLELYTRESAYLEVSFFQMEDKQITWHVKEGGGYVDETNVYTAPNEKGVYEIVAQSVAYPEIKASIFAVVRERE